MTLVRPCLSIGLLALSVGCAATRPAEAPAAPLAAERAQVAPPAREEAAQAPAAAEAEAMAGIPADRVKLVVTRADEQGRPLHLRAVVDPDALGPAEPVAVHDAQGPAEALLAPGRYHVLIFAEPGPFGFDVVLERDRPLTDVLVLSAPRGHTVLVDRCQPVGPGLTMVERQIVGFGWGPRPEDVLAAAADAADPAASAAESDALVRETLDRIQRALATARARQGQAATAGAGARRGGPASEPAPVSGTPVAQEALPGPGTGP